MNQVIGFILTLFSKFLDFYKKHKDVFYIGIIVLVILSAFLYIRSQNKKVVTIPQKPYYDSLFQVIEDRNGKLYAEIKTLRVENAAFLVMVDSLAKQLNIKPKTIKGEDRYIYKIDTTFIVKPETILLGKDTMYSIIKKDDYIDVSAIAGRDFGSISVKSVDTLIRVETSKTNIWGKTTDNVLIRNTNPYNKLQAGFSYSKVQKKTILTLGPAIIYDPFRNQVSAGISLQYPLIQFKK